MLVQAVKASHRQVTGLTVEQHALKKSLAEMTAIKNALAKHVETESQGAVSLQRIESNEKEKMTLQATMAQLTKSNQQLSVDKQQLMKEKTALKQQCQQAHTQAKQQQANASLEKQKDNRTITKLTEENEQLRQTHQATINQHSDAKKRSQFQQDFFLSSRNDNGVGAKWLNVSSEAGSSSNLDCFSSRG